MNKHVIGDAEPAVATLLIGVGVGSSTGSGVGASASTPTVTVTAWRAPDQPDPALATPAASATVDPNCIAALVAADANMSAAGKGLTAAGHAKQGASNGDVAEINQANTDLAAANAALDVSSYITARDACRAAATS
jgi:hypothetical protein